MNITDDVKSIMLDLQKVLARRTNITTNMLVDIFKGCDLKKLRDMSE